MAFSWAPFDNNVFLGHEAFSTEKKLIIISEKKKDTPIIALFLIT